MPLVVYKLGGSLLELADLSERVRSLWSDRPAGEIRLLVAGGGKAADLIREWDARFALGEAAAHDLAVASLRLSESLLVRLIPESVRVRTPEDVPAIAPERPGILCVEPFLDAAEGCGIAVPKCWDFTTDSISALAAVQCGAAELILLKSADLPESETVLNCVRRGGLDPKFGFWCGGIPRIGWVNLRKSPEIRWLRERGQTARV